MLPKVKRRGSSRIEGRVPGSYEHNDHQGVGAKLESVGLFFGFKEWVFAFFLLAGIFKPEAGSSDSLVDLTVFVAIITAGCVTGPSFAQGGSPSARF